MGISEGSQIFYSPFLFQEKARHIDKLSRLKKYARLYFHAKNVKITTVKNNIREMCRGNQSHRTQEKRKRNNFLICQA